MGMLKNGKWLDEETIAKTKDGEYIRSESQFRQFITQDGSSDFTAEPNRYHIYVSYACPWAHRTLVMRALKGLEDIISISSVNAYMGEHGWNFGASDQSTADPLYKLHYLYQLYLKADSNHTGKVTVPVLWDKKNKTIVNNESSEIIRMLNSEFNQYAKIKTDYYPQDLRAEIDTINDFVYNAINNGVYKTGFATKQSVYEEHYDELFSALDQLEKRLSQQTYLVRDQLTEADWRLFTTLIRFDPVYYSHFKCNKQRIIDYPKLSQYLRKLYKTPGVKETVHFDHIKDHYYQSHRQLNPTGIVPKGPDLSWLTI